MQLTKLTLGLGLSILLRSTAARNAVFYSNYDCKGSTIACQNIPPDFCCRQESPAFAFAGKITGFGARDVATLYNGPGGSLGNCGIAACVGRVGASELCCSAARGGSGISGGSYHTNPAKRDEGSSECVGTVKPNFLAAVDG